MNEESRRRVIDAVEQALKMAGAKGFEDAGEAIEKLSQLLHNFVKPLFNRQSLDQILQNLPERPQDEQMLLAIAENLPRIVGFGVQTFSSQVAKVFPTSNSGRPRALTSENQRLLCEHVGSLLAQGLDLKTAKGRAAQKFGVSRSTVERTWSGRKKGHKPSFEEMVDFLKPKNIVRPESQKNPNDL